MADCCDLCLQYKLYYNRTRSGEESRRHGIKYCAVHKLKYEYANATGKNELFGGAIAHNWSRWERESRTFFAACELGQKPNETQVAILLHTAGPEAQEINQTLVYANDDERKDYNSVLGKLRAYCEPRKNVVFERHRFWSRDQLEHETIGQWTTELRTRAANCLTT